MISFVKLNGFIDFFKYLPDAVNKIVITPEDLLEKNYGTEHDFDFQSNSFTDSEGYLINNMNTRLMKKIFKDESFQVSEEIEQNLFLLPDKENKVIYAKKVLRKLDDLFMYFNFDYSYIPVENGLFKSDEKIFLIQKCVRFLLETIKRTGTLFFEDPALSVCEAYVLRCFFKLETFSLDFAKILFSFNLNLIEIAEEANVVIVSGLIKNDTSTLLKLMGFSDTEINKYYFGIDETLSSPFNSPTDLSETIIDFSKIENIRKCFDGFLWEKEEISDRDFFKYWIVGRKPKFLPIKNKQITSFLYLYFGYINSSAALGKFTFTHSVTEATFNIEDVKGKKTKINTSTQGVIFIKKQLGPPVFKIQG